MVADAEDRFEEEKLLGIGVSEPKIQFFHKMS